MPVKSTSNRGAVEMQLDGLIRKSIEQTADDTLRIVQEMYRQPKSGRLYGVTAKKLKALRRYRAAKRKTAPTGLHRASAPGEAPAIDSGALRKGTKREAAQRVRALIWVVRLGVTSESGRGAPTGKTRRSVAHMLEFGTKRIKPRPAWRPALEIMRARLRR